MFFALDDCHTLSGPTIGLLPALSAFGLSYVAVIPGLCFLSSGFVFSS